ncbi:MAG: hypothetical protein ACRDPS_02680 [Nocardioides sp.]|uniref:hypothetical protein n=1 Tax=Nocardioides sp. TaxID=35761 RepID=UPI003D6B1305
MAVTYEQLQKWKPEELDAAADQLNTARKKLFDQQDELDAGSTPSSWIGQAATRAENRHRRLVSSLNDIAAPLSRVINALDEASPTIKKAKNSVQSAHDSAIGKGWKVDTSSPVTISAAGVETKDGDEATMKELAQTIEDALADAETAATELAAVLNSAKKGDYDGGDASLESASLPPELRHLPTDELIDKMLADPDKYDGYTDALSTWEQQQLGEEIANRFGDLTNPDAIGDDGTPPIGDPEAAKLAETLAAYGDDSTVSTAVLNKTGPDGFLNIQKNLLASMESGGWYMGEDQPYVTGDTMGDLQRAWGTTLASATNGTDGDNSAGTSEHVSGDWVQSLVERGDDDYDVAHAMGDTGSPRGFQLLAPMLRDGGHGSYLLNEVGTSMEKMERDAHGGGLIWRTGNGQLDFTQGTWDPLSDSDPNYDSGMDPFGALFEGMSHNPDAARDFLSGDLAGAGAVDDSKSRVEYYMTDRIWTALPDGFQPADSHFGDALVSATTEDADQRSADLTEEAFKSASDYINPGDNDTPAGELSPAMRRAMAHISGAYVPDVFAALSDSQVGTDYGPYADRQPAADLVGTVGMDGVREVLGDIGKDDEAYDISQSMAASYMSTGLDDYLSRSGLSPEEQVRLAQDNVIDPYANVRGALQEGWTEEQFAEAKARDEEASNSGDWKYDAGAWALKQVTGELAGKIPIVGGPIGDGTNSVIDSSAGYFSGLNDVDSTQETREIIAAEIGDGRRDMQTLVDAAVYDNLPANALPPDLRGPDGHKVPMTEWTTEQRDAWETARTNDPRAHAAAELLGNLVDQTNIGMDHANNEQDGG